MQHSIWHFSTAQRIVFGRGALDQLGDEVSALKVYRPLVVTDSTVAAIPVVADALGKLDQTFPGMPLFDQVRAEPESSIVEAAVAQCADTGVDCVIGIGGGSNIDVAKLVATLLAHGGSPPNYYGFDTIPGPVLPLVAVPTTAGTGSEVSHSAVVTDKQLHTKVSTLSRWLRPTVAIVDPRATDRCPARVTAHSGIDALVHAIEAYTNRDYTAMRDVDPQARAYEGSYPLTRMMAAEAIRLIGRSLENAVLQPHDEACRDAMAQAALLAGMAFSNSGVGIVHALEYPLGALTHCSHGEGNGLLLPHVMRFNLPYCYQQFADIARWLGINVQGLSLRQAAEQAILRIEEILDAIGVRRWLRDLGLPREAIPEVARKAHGIRRLMELNTHPPTEDELISILVGAYAPGEATD
ncbi:MAG: alcohol dehydrogenase [Pirellulaceae bacterium]|nr:MAG: alcohol dehydrogenase [Pirellulaceae bacterium]